MIEPIVSPTTVSVLHPGSIGFNANICPRSHERCGDLIRGQHCLPCEVDWNNHFDGAEAISTYTCSACDTEFPVLSAQADGVWYLASSDHCPTCGRSGSNLQSTDPDSSWDADQRADA